MNQVRWPSLLINVLSRYPKVSEPPLKENQYPQNELFQFPFHHTELPPFPPLYDFQDSEVDFLKWCNSFPSLKEHDGCITDVISLNFATNSSHGNEGIGFCDESGVVGKDTVSSGSVCRDEERRGNGQCNGRVRSSISIEFDEIKRYFYLPITKAAKELSVGLTVLKKRCRELGITRWPSRKMNSLRSLIHNVKRVGDNGDTIHRLEQLKRLLEREPEIELNEETKKLRQACFKANYKRRVMEATAA
ncbi:hypothetical protein MRB53_002572 [Persea americana]|uniref:Uncharacterized protein n=1 Tax=Persea americana TaxID=3435 RepID=A0ACC2MV29_PERAE|nr:hypothetical protein MRB53_002572 [Persea americana]